MRRLLLFILILATGRTVFAQQQELEVTLALLQEHPHGDSTRINLLNDLAYYYSRVDPAKGLETADQAIALCDSLQDESRLASAYSYKGMNYGSLGEDSLALRYYQLALSLHEKQGNELRIATSHNNIAIALVNLSQYQEALKHHAQAFEIFKVRNDSIRMANSLNNSAVVYLYLNDYRQSLDYNLQALKIFDRLDNKLAKANTHINIGLVYQHLSEFDKALSNQQQAYAIFEESGDKPGMINSLGNIGNIYHDADSTLQALDYYSRSLELSKETGDKRGIASNTSNIGRVYRTMGEYERSLRYFENALKLNEQSGDKKRVAGDLNQMAYIYLDAPKHLLRSRSKFIGDDDIIAMAMRSLEIGGETGSLDVQRDAWDILSRIYERRSMYDNALAAHKQFVALRDSIINTDVKNDILNKELQFSFERKEMTLRAAQERRQAEIIAQINRHRLIRNSSVIIALVVIAAAIATFIFYKRKRDATEKQKAAEYKLKEAANEMDLLLLQMNPHFIFNSLNSINHYMRQNEAEKASLFTTRFAGLMRLTLENSRKKEITLASDIFMLEQYLELELLRLKNRFSYEIKLDSSIDPDLIFVPPMLLQPFVENSIWHGISRRPEGGGRILINVGQEGGSLKYIVEDNGGGRKPDQLRPHGNSSMGIKITKNRIQMLNELKGGNASLRLVDLENGLRVELTLPLETDIE